MGHFCTSCGTQMPDQANHCPNCGQAQYSNSPRSIGNSGRTTAISENVAGALAYITIFPAVLFLVIDPYNRNPFIRFHSFQSIMMFLLLFLLHAFLNLLPFFGHAVMLAINIVAFVAWIVVLFKAFNGERFQLPFIGEFAQKQADAV